MAAQNTKTKQYNLPVTAYALLGLVNMLGEASGYDLKQCADQSIRHFFWSPAKSHIYAELNRLASLDLVAEREVEQERRPDKCLFWVTEEGQRALQGWLERPELAPEVTKSTFLLKLFFGHMVSLETIEGWLEEYRGHAEATLAQFEALSIELSSQNDMFFANLTLDSGLAHTRAAIQWADEALSKVRTRRLRQNETPSTTPGL